MFYQISIFLLGNAILYFLKTDLIGASIASNSSVGLKQNHYVFAAGAFTMDALLSSVLTLGCLALLELAFSVSATSYYSVVCLLTYLSILSFFTLRIHR
ncbi:MULTISPECIES: hypothetical protein [unclassified Pseudovibrio]|uniref:hypothetical protein n=1 Tax=unclassified Pseudovibrio TaxID=2627060 RepID=UPI0007AE955C|nr:MULTISPECIES: hypothetical protein [unclassified Pseudovibrio]KZL02602.1 hypothetical protein PsW74_01705 [Pseudovibrio sp. W74]KZL07855.1 hypothetical protein PsAD14_02997 [Pseudovibrio sp. Ad14]